MPQTDVELGGALPLLVERAHVSSYRSGRWFGSKWASTLDQRLEIDSQGVTFYTDDGAVQQYPVPLPDVPVLPVAGGRRPLTWDGTPGGTMAVTDPDTGANGISAFMVNKDDEGFSVGPKERKMGIKGSPTTELYFENCHIPGDRIIGEPGTGLKTALKTLDHTRPTVGAQAVGVAQGALDAAIAYTKDRKQFGKSISSFQAVQFELADMAMKVEAARLLVYTAAARAQRGEPDLSFISAAAKCFASDVAMDVTESAVQLLGGAGYTRDFPVERMMRDAKITQIYEGTNQIQHIVMSRALLAA